MSNLNFKKWLEDAMQPTDPTIMAAQQAVLAAGQQAVAAKKNPILAMQQAALKSKVPLNKMGDLMPKDGNDKNTPNGVK